MICAAKEDLGGGSAKEDLGGGSAIALTRQPGQGAPFGAMGGTSGRRRESNQTGSSYDSVKQILLPRHIFVTILTL